MYGKITSNRRWTDSAFILKAIVSFLQILLCCSYDHQSKRWFTSITWWSSSDASRLVDFHPLTDLHLHKPAIPVCHGFRFRWSNRRTNFAEANTADVHVCSFTNLLYHKKEVPLADIPGCSVSYELLQLPRCNKQTESGEVRWADAWCCQFAGLWCSWIINIQSFGIVHHPYTESHRNQQTNRCCCTVRLFGCLLFTNLQLHGPGSLSCRYCLLPCSAWLLTWDTLWSCDQDHHSMNIHAHLQR